MPKQTKTASPARTAAPAKPAAAAAASASPAAASTGSAAQSSPASGSSEAISLDNVEKRLSALLQTDDETTSAAANEETEPGGEATVEAGQEPSPEETQATAAETESPAPGEEAATEGDPNAEGEPAPEGEVEPGEAEGAPEWAKKRIDKLTAQKYELREQVETLQAQVKELETKATETPAAAAPAAAANPLGNVKNEADLAAKENEAERLLDLVEDQLVTLRRNPDAVTRWFRDNKIELKDGEGNEDYSRESMEAFLMQTRRNLDKTVRVFIPQRRQHLQAAQHFEQVASKEFGFITDRKSPEHAVAQEVLQYFPGIQNRPDWKIIVGVHTLGLLALRDRRDKAKAGAAGSGKAKPAAIAPRVATATAIPARADARKVQGEQAREKMLKSGDPTDYIKSALGRIAA